MGTHVTLTSSDGHTLDAYRAEPPDAPRGGVVVIQEIFGVNGHIRDVADRFAADGWLVIAPAMYDRVQRGYEAGYTPEAVAEGRALRARIPLDAVLRDVEAAVVAASAAGRVGIVGYCWGGFVTWMAAARVPGLACAAPYYGVGILDNAAEAPRVPVAAHFGEQDADIPADGVRALAERYPQHQIHLYPADHGFNCDRRGSYHAESARLARERTVALFRAHVG